MDFHIKTLVFNEPYINNFLNYSFPSLLSPNNLPAIIKIANVEFHVYTHTQEEVNKISNELGKYNNLLPIKIQTAPIEKHLFHYSPGDQTAQEIFWDYFITKNPGIVPTFFLNSDNLWSDSSLNYIVNSLMKGNVAIFPSVIRTAADTIIPELDLIKENGIINLSPLLTQQLIIKHLSPVSKAFYYNSHNYPHWCESILIPVGTEGILVYYVVRGFHAFIPGRFNIVSGHLVNENYYTHKIDTIQNANDCIGIDLALPLSKMSWVEQGTPFSTQRIAQFLKDPRWENPVEFNIESLKRPTRICTVENPTKELWNKVEKEIEETLVREIIRG